MKLLNYVYMEQRNLVFHEPVSLILTIQVSVCVFDSSTLSHSIISVMTELPQQLGIFGFRPNYFPALQESDYYFNVRVQIIFTSRLTTSYSKWGRTTPRRQQ